MEPVANTAREKELKRRSQRLLFLRRQLCSRCQQWTRTGHTHARLDTLGTLGSLGNLDTLGSLGNLGIPHLDSLGNLGAHNIPDSLDNLGILNLDNLDALDNLDTLDTLGTLRPDSLGNRQDNTMDRLLLHYPHYTKLEPLLYFQNSVLLSHQKMK